MASMPGGIGAGLVGCEDDETLHPVIHVAEGRGTVPINVCWRVDCIWVLPALAEVADGAVAIGEPGMFLSFWHDIIPF